MPKGIKLDKTSLEYTIKGGMILGGGGGGNPDMGRKFAEIAVEYSDLYLADIADVPDESIILTVSNVGAPAATNRYLSPAQTVRPIQIILQNADIQIGGIITNENGGNASVNGWLQASVLGIPLLDAPCNGRAHPTGVMGSLNLHKQPDYVTVQGAAGGNPETGDELECFFQGSIDHTSNLVRSASVEAGGVINVARNPVTASYARDNCAIGGISHAIQTGEVFVKGLEKSVDYAVSSVMDFLKGRVVAKGTVTDFSLTTEGGYDIGTCIVGGCELTFWNEYMTLDKDGERAATFPDLIMTIDAATGEPLTTAMIQQGQEVYVVATDMRNLRLSSTMYEADLIREVEEVIGKEMLKYLDLTKPVR